MVTTCGITKLLEKKNLRYHCFKKKKIIKYCDVALVAIIHKTINPNLALKKNGS
jgi:hypothetical protein